LISITKLYQENGQWYYQGSSEVFDTREEALKRLMSQSTKKKIQSNRGRKFVSQKLNMEFRSNWEILIAEMLTDLNIEFDYEPERVYFRAERESYLCDFYLPEYNCWIEIKGYMDKRSLRRVKLFKKYYGAEAGFFLIEKDELDLLKKTPELIYTFIEIAEKERERIEKQLQN
jgi:hypothetical protein